MDKKNVVSEKNMQSLVKVGSVTADLFVMWTNVAWTNDSWSPLQTHSPWMEDPDVSLGDTLSLRVHQLGGMYYISKMTFLPLLHLPQPTPPLRPAMRKLRRINFIN